MGKVIIDNSNELEFAIFCIENIAIYLGIEAKQIYDLLTEKSDILYSYIIPEYEILHTQSKEYIVNDKVFNTVELYFDGLIDKNEALKRLKYEKPNLQICFRSENALKYLQFERSETV